ncbi:hypothetical protein G6O67_008095 [Ophiocordyceps sinensis]|uniref:Cyclin N-terminal domain-containing protein n=2 Tax=Ophiocordyceps sinensis TaxID=72228 RepID=A0A8H4PNA2_9HYPO|nr:cyclin [Ophiocordyceps sinensis CO18]KAF4504670.1 hypothetical protein G6O67_008095 [Ophiocordyceps sinensis]
MASRHVTVDELNKAALEHFVYQPVSRDMISYLADAAHNVINCDATLMPSKNQALPPTPPRSPEPGAQDDGLPTLDAFITQLVVSSNVQVPTLMSTLVYLTRLKAKLQPMARGLRCTTHRIFLASLILAAKYLNDSSPKNKHWANYTHMSSDLYSFGFTRTEVNLMEKQLLFLLEWDLRISEQDLYLEFDCFLEPLRVRIVERHARKMRQREEKRRQQDLFLASTRYPSPAASRATSCSRNASPDNLRPGSLSPPGLTYSSSASSYASSAPSSAPSSRQQSRSPTPMESDPEATSPCETPQHGPPYSPIEIVVLDTDSHKAMVAPSSARMLPYEISVDQYHQMHDGAAKKRHKRGMWGRLLGGAVTVR